MATQTTCKRFKWKSWRSGHPNHNTLRHPFLGGRNRIPPSPTTNMGIKLVSRSQASKVSKHVNLQAGHYINIFFALSSHSRRSMNRLLVKLLSLWLKLLPRRLAIKVYCWVADFLQDLFPIVDQCWLNEYVHVYVYCIEVFSCVAQISNKKFNRYSCQDEAPPTEETEEQQEALSNTLMYYYNIKLIPKI